MVAERRSLKLLTTEKPHGPVEENVVNRVEVEKTRINKKIEQTESPRRRSTTRPSTSRYRRIRSQTKLLM